MPVLSSIGDEAKSVAGTIRSTWQEPSDVLSILLIIGGDVVLKTLAQLSGHTLVPVPFSFGWVAYSFNTLMAVVGDGRLMPLPDYPVKVINAANGFARDNRSWVICRLLRDFEHHLPPAISLRVTIFQVSDHPRAGIPDIDWCWFSGLGTIIVQAAVATIPCALHGDWSILLVTAAGTALALATGSLPQWRFEKWACRTKTKKVISITGGIGSRHVMVVISGGKGLDLEDLAVAESPRLFRRLDFSQGRSILGLPFSYWFTQTFCLLLAIAWLLLLITVTSLKKNTWYLLLVGGLGMLQNVIVAGARRAMSTSGIHLKKVEAIEGEKVMHTLMDLERAYATVGKSLLPEFFPNAEGLTDSETRWVVSVFIGQAHGLPGVDQNPKGRNLRWLMNDANARLTKI
ncbi:hypothetical protein BDV93DRAFT_588261 [Ceratobasidium sp. AG-I]|nr:hypothetical protein BDV93DRAFT_588261 [Ceratobasidium sp. AG-I]